PGPLARLPLTRPRALRPFSRERRAGVDEADRVPERVAGVEAPLTPGAGCDLAKILAAGFPSSIETSLQGVDREVHVVRIRAGVEIVRVGTRIEAGENRAAAVEVVPAR